MFEGYDYFSIGSYVVSSNNKLFVYFEDMFSWCIYIVYVKSLESEEKFDDVLEGIFGSVVWVNDNIYFIYVKKDL